MFNRFEQEKNKPPNDWEFIQMLADLVRYGNYNLDNTDIDYTIETSVLTRQISTALQDFFNGSIRVANDNAVSILFENGDHFVLTIEKAATYNRLRL